MIAQDQPFLEADASRRYRGLRTKQIYEYRFVPWGKIAMWIGATGAGLAAALWVVSRYAV